MVNRDANMLINLSGGLTVALHWFLNKSGIKRLRQKLESERKKYRYNEKHLNVKYSELL
jgi:hypothetical protein